MRLVFLGTPEFALPSLERLLAGPDDVVGVYTQPDRPAGRGRAPSASPVKRFALAHGLPVYQPERLRRPEAIEQLRALLPDCLIVAAYGQILPQAVLDLPKHGALNLHPSLLPRHRGAAPVAGAILAGDEITGVTLMLVDAGLDTGPIVAQATLPVAPDDTTATLTAKLALLAADLLVMSLPHWFAGRLTPSPQDQAQMTLTRQLTIEDRTLDWRQPASILERRVRALQPWPEATTTWQGRLLKVLQAIVLPHQAGEPGLVVAPEPAGPVPVGIVTGEGVLGLLRVQMEGRRAMAAEEFLRGARGFVGARLPS